MLVGDTKSLSAGRQNSHRRGPLEDRVDQFGRGITQVLTVVDDEQLRLALHRLGDTLRHRGTRLLSDTEHRGDGVRHRIGIGDGRQLQKPYAVRELVTQLERYLHSQTRLADTTDAGQA